MADNNFSKNFFLAALLGLALLTIFILMPFVIALLSAGILAYIFYPVQKRLSKRINKRISAFLIVLFILVSITSIVYFVGNEVTREGYGLFLGVKQKLSSDSLAVTDCVQNPKAFCGLSNRVVVFLKDPQVKFYVEDAISKLSNYITNQTFSIISNLPSIIVDFLIMFFTIYHLLIDGVVFISKIKKAIPLKSHHVDDIITQFDNLTFATLYGKLITALIQGFIGGVTFYLLGLQTPILAGIGMAFFAFLPMIGTPIIWLPAAVTLLLEGDTAKGLILLLIGVFIISSIDNILKPMIIGNRAHLHPAVILVGILGGIYLMGPIGIITGPLIISLLISFIEVYYKEGY